MILPQKFEAQSPRPKWLMSFSPKGEREIVSSLTWAFFRLLFYFSSLRRTSLKFPYPNIRITFCDLFKKLSPSATILGLETRVPYKPSFLPECHTLPSLTWMQSES